MLTDTAESREDGKCTRGIISPVRFPYCERAFVDFGYIESLKGISIFSMADKNDEAALEDVRGRAICDIFLKAEIFPSFGPAHDVFLL